VLLVTDRWLPLVSPVLAWYAQARWPPMQFGPDIIGRSR
jgi:hypothetical protein